MAKTGWLSRNARWLAPVAQGLGIIVGVWIALRVLDAPSDGFPHDMNATLTEHTRSIESLKKDYSLVQEVDGRTTRNRGLIDEETVERKKLAKRVATLEEWVGARRGR